MRGSRVELRAPERGEKRRLQELAQRNAELALSSETLVAETKRLRRVEALEELREVLNLESLPLRIECFDISNIQGQEIVGSMVVFEDGVAKKAHYRKFAVRGQAGQDDFAAMAEVVARRFARLAAGAAAEEYDESFAATPNLVVIDGGKGQLAAALAAMQAYDLPRVAVISLAKRVEEVFVPGLPDPVVLPETSSGLQLLQRLRDEAHRFAITFHRQRRDSAARESMFDQLDGVGPVRRRALAAPFRLGRARARARAREELEGVPGVPAKTARRHLRAASSCRPGIERRQHEHGLPGRTVHVRRGPRQSPQEDEERASGGAGKRCPRSARSQRARSAAWHCVSDSRRLEAKSPPPVHSARLAARRPPTAAGQPPRAAQGRLARPAVAAQLAFVALRAHARARALAAHGDSGELIASAYVLGVAHPPGYPLYMLLGHAATPGSRSARSHCG